MIASVFLLASWLGCIIVSIAGMMMGRRMWTIAGSITQILGSIVSVSNFGYGQLIAGRVLVVSQHRLREGPGVHTCRDNQRGTDIL